MAVWILHQPLTADEETRVEERAYLDLPFEGMPDLSTVHSRGACRNLLQSLYPDMPPETLDRRIDRLWNGYGQLRKGDLAAIPLPQSKQVVLAEVTDPYQYQPQSGQPGLHRMAVKWHSRRLRFSSLRQYQDMLKHTSERLAEITDAELRTRLREHLPHGSNRFARWKWLLAAFTVMNIIALLATFAHSFP